MSEGSNSDIEMSQLQEGDIMRFKLTLSRGYCVLHIDYMEDTASVSIASVLLDETEWEHPHTFYPSHFLENGQEVCQARCFSAVFSRLHCATFSSFNLLGHEVKPS